MVKKNEVAQKALEKAQAEIQRLKVRRGGHATIHIPFYVCPVLHFVTLSHIHFRLHGIIADFAEEGK